MAAAEVPESSITISVPSESQVTDIGWAASTQKAIIGDFAGIIGITPAALTEEINNGKTIVEAATATGTSEEDLVTPMVESIIQNADTKEMTPEEYTEYKEVVATKMHLIVTDNHYLLGE